MKTNEYINSQIYSNYGNMTIETKNALINSVN